MRRRTLALGVIGLFPQTCDTPSVRCGHRRTPVSDKPDSTARDKPHPKTLPEPVREGMENVAAAIFAGPPKKDWRYQNKQ